MSFGSVRPAKLSREKKAFCIGQSPSMAFSAIEDTEDSDSIHGSELEKALSAHFMKFADIISPQDINQEQEGL